MRSGARAAAVAGWGMSQPTQINADNITTEYLSLDRRHLAICVIVHAMDGWTLRKFGPDTDGDWTLRFYRDPISLEFLVDPSGDVSCVFRRETAWIRSWDWESGLPDQLAERVREAKAEAENHFKA